MRFSISLVGFEDWDEVPKALLFFSRRSKLLQEPPVMPVRMSNIFYTQGRITKLKAEREAAASLAISTKEGAKTASSRNAEIAKLELTFEALVHNEEMFQSARKAAALTAFGTTEFGFRLETDGKGITWSEFSNEDESIEGVGWQTDGPIAGMDPNNNLRMMIASGW